MQTFEICSNINVLYIILFIFYSSIIVFGEKLISSRVYRKVDEYIKCFKQNEIPIIKLTILTKFHEQNKM